MNRAFGLDMGLRGIGIRRQTMEKAGRQVLMLAAMFILCRLRPAMGLAPFAAAVFAGVLGTGFNPAGMLAGGLLGSIGGTPVRVDLTFPAGAAIALGGGLVWDSLRKRLRLGTSPPERAQMLACGVLAGFATLFPGLAAAQGDLWASAQAVCCAVAASSAAPFVMAAACAGGNRNFLTVEERTGGIIVLCGIAGGLASLYAPLAACFGAFAALALFPAGSLVSVLTGAAIILAGGGTELPGMICLGGVCGQLFSERSKVCRAACGMAALFAGGLFLQEDITVITGAVLGAGIYALLPDNLSGRLADMARQNRASYDPDRLAVQLRRQSARRLQALGDAFGELAECYLAAGCSGADEEYLIGKMRDRLCSGCPGYERCWDGGSGAVRFLCGLVSDAVEWAGTDSGKGLFEEDMPPDVLRMCRRGRLVPERLEDMLTDFALRRQAEKRRGSENRLISAQFLQAQQLLDGLAREQMKPVKLRNRQSARAAAILEGMGIPLSEVMMLGHPRVEMIAVLKEGRWTREMARDASAQLTKRFGRTYLPEGEPGREMRFVRCPEFYADTGAGCISREAGVPSGDSHLVEMIDDERMLFLISDGMGSGEAAARESAAAVKLLARFLSAGVSCALAIETVNAMLLSRSSEDMFATVDMLILNLSTGAAEFIKLAACPSLIARDEGIYRVEGGRLPMGILEKVQPAVTRIQLQPGDVILMASDGVMDAVDVQLLYDDLRSGGKSMPDMAQTVLNLAENTRRNFRRDDMTAICVRVDAHEGLRKAI